MAPGFWSSAPSLAIAGTNAKGKNLGLFFFGETGMTKLEAVIQPSRLDAVKDILLDLGVEGMTISDARGQGRHKNPTKQYRGHEYTVDLLPKVKLEIVVPDDRVEITVNAILSGASTGKIGDGKIFLSRIHDAVRIRNHDRGEIAL